MRISDRSSDVCSSDLIDHAHVRDADVLVAAVLLVVRDTDMWISKETRAVRLGGRACRRTTIEAMHRVPPLRCCVPVSQARGKVCDGHRPQKIGSASGRERRGQYVWNSVGAGSLK